MFRVRFRVLFVQFTIARARPPIYFGFLGLWCDVTAGKAQPRWYESLPEPLEAGFLRWSGSFGQFEGRNKVYWDCDVMPSGPSYPLPVTGVEVR